MKVKHISQVNKLCGFTAVKWAVVCETQLNQPSFAFGGLSICAITVQVLEVAKKHVTLDRLAHCIILRYTPFDEEFLKMC